MKITNIETIKVTDKVVNFKVHYIGWFGIKKEKEFIITSMTSTSHCLHDANNNTLFGSGFSDPIRIYAGLNELQDILKFKAFIKY